MSAMEALSPCEPPPGPLSPKILLVDDDPSFRDLTGQMLRFNGFDVTEAADVPNALKLIGAQSFDVLLSDLHMPAPGDGLTVVSAMRHSHPQAVTLIMSSFPEMEEATKAILRQTDEVLVKPIKIDALVAAIHGRLRQGAGLVQPVQSLASILERETFATIKDWLQCVAAEPKIMAVALQDKRRCAHLPALFADLVFRLLNPLPLGTHALVSSAAMEHGSMRRRQGYTAAMLVEESRLLQVSIFQTLQDNLERIDFSLLLVGVMAIADEVDSQLAQQMAGYISESPGGLGPVELSPAALHPSSRRSPASAA